MGRFLARPNKSSLHSKTIRDDNGLQAYDANRIMEFGMDDKVVLRVPVERWNGPFAPAIQAAALTALEAGRVIVLPQLPFALETSERILLSAGALDNTRKNISFDPATGAAMARARGGEAAAAGGHARPVRPPAQTLIHGLFPRYAASWNARAPASARPRSRGAPPRRAKTISGCMSTLSDAPDARSPYSAGILQRRARRDHARLAGRRAVSGFRREIPARS